MKGAALVCADELPEDLAAEAVCEMVDEDLRKVPLWAQLKHSQQRSPNGPSKSQKVCAIAWNFQ
jgi:hypothetical protein